MASEKSLVGWVAEYCGHRLKARPAPQRCTGHWDCRRARQGEWPEAHAGFKNVNSAISALPIELQRMALRTALRTAIEVRDFNGADRIISELATVGAMPATDPSVAVLVGRLAEGMGRN